jgi:putative ABC transport system permease protein
VTNNGAVQKLLISLGVIVLFILVLAVCNFINITISSSFSRLKEIGVRKVIGGLKKQVIIQFLTESVVMTFASAILSLVFYELLHSYFSGVLDTSLPSLLDFSISFWAWIFAGVFVIGIFAGCYPSIYLSGTKTIESLKGKFKSVKGTIRFSRGLVTVQFLIAVFIFISALIMSKQVSYFLNKDLGYDKSFVLLVTSVRQDRDSQERARSFPQGQGCFAIVGITRK